MSVTLILALLVQIIMLAALRMRLGRAWLTRPVTMLALAAVAYHGLSEIILFIPSTRQWDPYRTGTSQAFINTAALIISLGMLALVLGYLVTGPEKTAREAGREKANISAISTVDWRIYALACAPLAFLTYQGRGYNALAGNAVTPKVLASTFLVVLVVLTAFSFLGRYGMRWFLSVLMVQSLLLAAVGERAPVTVAIVSLILLLWRAGLRPTRRQIAVTLLVGTTTILAITGYRAAYGRAIYYSDSGLLTRVEALGTGLYSVTHTSNGEDTAPGLVTQLAIRLDGNSFAGSVLQDMSGGQPGLGVLPAAKTLLLAVPTSLWPTKSASAAQLNPALTSINQFGLASINYLPTMAGLYMGYIGTTGTIVFLAAFGFLCGLGERWIFTKYTIVRLVLLASSVQAVLKYEAGLPMMFVTLRAGIMVAIIVKVLEVATRRRHSLATVPHKTNTPEQI